MNLQADWLRRMVSSLINFSRDLILVEGVITLLIIAKYLNKRIIMLDFLVIKILSTYNTILGWIRLNMMQAVVSIYHLMMRFPTSNNVGEVRGNEAMAQQCNIATFGKNIKPLEMLPIEGLDVQHE